MVDMVKLKRWYAIYMTIIGIFGELVFFAQAYKIFTTESAEDLSLFAFIAGLIAVASWLVHGLIIKDRPLIIANAVASVGAVLVVWGILIYG